MSQLLNQLRDQVALIRGDHPEVNVVQSDFFNVTNQTLAKPQSHREEVGWFVSIGLRLNEEMDTITPEEFQEALRLLPEIFSPLKCTLYLRTQPEVPVSELEQLRKHIDEAVEDPNYRIITNYPVEVVCSNAPAWNEVEITKAYDRINPPGEMEPAADADQLISVLKGNPWP